MAHSAPTSSIPDLASLTNLFQRQQQHRWVVAASTAKTRIAKLRGLHDLLLERRADLHAALWADLRKNPTEVDFTEIGVVNTEIRHTVRRLRSWMEPKPVGTPLVLIGTTSEVRRDPKGVCLILSPWNFPLNLALVPLVSAVAAGNTVVLKPSEFTPHTSALIAEIVGQVFSEEEVAVVQGGVETAKALMTLPFNHVFFTGGPEIGKEVMKAAAVHLSSITLELGGKSPVLVDETADLDVAAARLAWFKGMNAGQSCIASDYVLVQESVHDALLQKTAACLEQFYGATVEARQSGPDLARLINDRHFQRSSGFLDDALARGGRLAWGGQRDASTRYFEPTLLAEVPDGALVWKEELFCPILPFRPYETLEAAVAYVNDGHPPLALYMFSGNKKHIQTVVAGTRSGGVAINDIGLHFYNGDLPFGGVNFSGFGRCHGEAGFLEFTNPKAVCRQNRLFPHTNIFLPPYRSGGLADMLLKGVMRWF